MGISLSSISRTTRNSLPPRAMRAQPVAQSPACHFRIATEPQVAPTPLFHACDVAASNTDCGGMRTKHRSSRSWSVMSAAPASRSHLAFGQYSPTMMGVLVTCRVRPSQTVGRLPANLSG